MADAESALGSRCLIRAGEVLAADPDGLKVLVVIASVSPCVLTYDRQPLQPALPDPSSRRARRQAARGMALQPGDVLIDNETDLTVRCIRGGNGEVRCNGRRLMVGK